MALKSEAIQTVWWKIKKCVHCDRRNESRRSTIWHGCSYIRHGRGDTASKNTRNRSSWHTNRFPRCLSTKKWLNLPPPPLHFGENFYVQALPITTGFNSTYGVAGSEGWKFPVFACVVVVWPASFFIPCHASLMTHNNIKGRGKSLNAPSSYQELAKLRLTLTTFVIWTLFPFCDLLFRGQTSLGFFSFLFLHFHKRHWHFFLRSTSFFQCFVGNGLHHHEDPQ